MGLTQKEYGLCNNCDDHGSRGYQMWWLDNCGTYHTPGLAAVCSSEVVDHCPFILVFFPTPGAVGEASKMPKGIWVMDTH